MDVEVPGGQQAFIDPTDGSFSFSTPHGSAPQGSILTGFEYNPTGINADIGELTFDGEGFFACPTNGTFPYQIFVLEAGVADAECIGISVATATSEGIAAWEYT